MSTRSSFAEQFGQRVRTRGIDLVTSGSGASLSLAPKKGFSATVPVARALVRRGVKPSVAKSVVERLADGHAAAVSVKHYDEVELNDELSAAHVEVRRHQVDVKSLAEALVNARKSLKMSQDQFANAMCLPVGTVRNWEQARTKLDAPTELLLRMVASAPDLAVEVAAAQNSAIDTFIVEARPAQAGAGVRSAKVEA